RTDSEALPAPDSCAAACLLRPQPAVPARCALPAHFVFEQAFLRAPDQCRPLTAQPGLAGRKDPGDRIVFGAAMGVPLQDTDAAIGTDPAALRVGAAERSLGQGLALGAGIRKEAPLERTFKPEPGICRAEQNDPRLSCQMHTISKMQQLEEGR